MSTDNIVSIIIPIYNVIEYVDQCIESAVKQTYPSIEIILVDDGSTDGSAKKCDKWAKTDSRIKVIHKQNGGLSDARNAGLDAASGDFIYFLDGDDYIDKKLLEKTIPQFENGADLVSFQYYLTYPDGRLVESPFIPREYLFDKDEERLKFVIYDLLQYRLGWEAWGRVFRRDIIENHNIRFADNKKIFAEDLYFSLCYVLFTSKVSVISDQLYYYRQRDNSIMGDQIKQLNAGRMNELCKELLHYYEQYRESLIFREHFAVIYYLVMQNVMERYRCNNKLRVPSMRRALLEDISDYKFAGEMFRKISKERSLLYPVYNDARIMEYYINLVRFYADGNKVLYIIKRYYTSVIHRMIDLNRSYKESAFSKIRDFCSNRKKCYLIGTEDFGNIGDNKIAESQLAFINCYFSEYDVIEITASKYNEVFKYLKKYIKKDDIIFLQGGGNFGNEYPFSHGINISVCNTWKTNRKIIFPQTIYYTKNPDGENQLQKDKETYCGDRNISLFTREKTSYEFAKSNFTCDIYCIPDIVLFNQGIEYDVTRSGVLICLRDDKEKVFSQSDRECLTEYLEQQELTIETTDLQLSYNVRKEDRRYIIEDRLKKFCGAQLVITDRLHGMIFAAITGTPCVVFSNYNHKVKDTYDWISYLPYIKYVNTVEDAKNVIPELLEMKNCKYDNSPLLPYFDELAKVISERP